MDLFEKKAVRPMLIAEEQEAFDSPDYIFELKLDGERGIAYLDPKAGTELRNKRNRNMLQVFPELGALHKQARKRCILDGEYVCLDSEGKPDFSQVQRRSLMTTPFKIELAARKNPVSFVAYDILYYDSQDVKGRPLLERKALLDKAVKEGGQLAISRYVEMRGKELYRLTEQQGLEGIVAKRKDSIYVEGKRTKDWSKCKYYLDDDFVVCGYIRKQNGMNSIIIGQYDGNQLVYKGHVTLGASEKDFRAITMQPTSSPIFQETPAGNENAVWIQPDLVCKVEFMQHTASGSMRQPVFRGLRVDKEPLDCQIRR